MRELDETEIAMISGGAGRGDGIGEFVFSPRLDAELRQLVREQMARVVLEMQYSMLGHRHSAS